MAGVGIIRLVANTNFPIERREVLIEKLDKLSVQIAPPRRAKILDAEADAELFSRCKTTEDLQCVWEAGVRRNLRTELLRLKAMGQKQPTLSIDRYNDSSPAFQAYDEVRRGCFLDQDTINAKLFKDRQDRQEVIRKQMDESRAARARHSATNTPTFPQ